MNIDKFISAQLASWAEAARRHADLDSSVITRTVDVSGLPIILQHNPARAVSTGARVDSLSIASRPCFLCRANRMAEQIALQYNGYEILVNPYPVFRDHLTIVAADHCDQRIDGRLEDMLSLASDLEGFTVFYNGPRCGASAPDHAHFQAAPSECFPVWDHAGDQTEPIRILSRPTVMVMICSTDPTEIAGRFNNILSQLPREADEVEPKINLLARKRGQEYHLIVIPRRKHRPANFGIGEGEIMISPASIDMAGVMVVPRREDFDTLGPDQIESILLQTGYSASEIKLFLSPRISVGIMEAKAMDVDLHGPYMLNDTEMVCDTSLRVARPSMLRPLSAASTATLRGVTIGIDFHWQQQQDQTFEGELEFASAEGGMLTAINRLPIERYIQSVISSEMNADAPLEFLKAHAVISRSWALAQIVGCGRELECQQPVSADQEAIIKWYDHASHTRFDVCADDHCQRYQGVGRVSVPQVAEAIEATRSLVLTYKGELCDARFSKCCGGVTERFSTCWQPVDFAYLPAVTDRDPSVAADLSEERDAHQWITTNPDAFCADPGPEVLAMVLNSYDRDTPHLYRWSVEYSAEELAEIVKRRSGLDFGRIVGIEPLHRGPSGRIDRLRIEGTKLTRIIGKELEIRRTLSPSHLYSSAFVVESGEKDESGVARRWRLRGAGWGHGVGLCQIGAAVMATRGYDYRTILSHYFPGSELTTIDTFHKV